MTFQNAMLVNLSDILKPWGPSSGSGGSSDVISIRGAASDPAGGDIYLGAGDNFVPLRGDTPGTPMRVDFRADWAAGNYLFLSWGWVFKSNDADPIDGIMVPRLSFDDGATWSYVSGSTGAQAKYDGFGGPPFALPFATGPIIEMGCLLSSNNWRAGPGSGGGAFLYAERRKPDKYQSGCGFLWTV